LGYFTSSQIHLPKNMEMAAFAPFITQIQIKQSFRDKSKPVYREDASQESSPTTTRIT